MSRRSTRRQVAAAVLAVASITSCTEAPSEPAGLRSPSERQENVLPSAGRHLVLSMGNGFRAEFSNVVASLGGTVVASHQGAGIAVVSGLTADAAAQLASDTDVAEVQADATVSIRSPRAPQQSAMELSNVTASSVLNPATAVLFTWQWNMRAIGANTVWPTGNLGAPGVTVAILDSGIDYDALDLNGLVDLSRSTSFSVGDNQIRAQFFPTRHNISDFNGHGTNVATMVSSKAVAFAGVTSRTTLMGVKVLGRNGSGSIADILNGVLWAADHGADVANMSLGAEYLKTGAGPLTSFLNRIFNYTKQRGMLSVVAAGNDGLDLDHNGNESSLFCDMPHVICVSAMGPTTATGPVDLPSFYTDFGRSAITVAAPGGNAGPTLPITAWPWGPDFASWVWSLCAKTLIAGLTPGGTPILTSCVAGNRLLGFIGTSQAAPHVAGLAALLVSKYGRGQPTQIKSLIVKSADDVGQPGTDPFFGRGRINVAKALGF